MPAAMPCKTPPNFHGETRHNIGKQKTKYACIVEADASLRIQLEGVPHRDHEDHIAAKGINSLSHYNLVHKFIPMPQAFKIPYAKAAVEKEWKKLKKIPTWQLTKVRYKKEVIEEARDNGRKVHFTSLMDLCHLKNSELEPQFQKYKGRVVLRFDIVKDDSGSCAVFTEQGSSGSQMTASKSHGHYIQTSRIRRTSSRRSRPSHPGQNGRCTIIVEKSEVTMSRCLDTSTEAQIAQIMV